MTECQSECEDAIVVCLSVNFDSATKICYFNDADTSTSAVTSPCPTSTTQYSEQGEGLLFCFDVIDVHAYPLFSRQYFY